MKKEVSHKIGSSRPARVRRRRSWQSRKKYNVIKIQPRDHKILRRLCYI